MKSNAKLIVATLMIAVGTLIAHPARAADPAKVERLLQVLKIDQQMGKMMDLMEKSMQQKVVEIAKKKGLTPAQIERGEPVIKAAMKKVFEESFSWEFMKPRLANVYVEELTDAEVDGAIAYYGSPQGQSMIVKMPVLMQRGMDIGMKRGQQMEPQIEATLDAAFKQIRADEAKLHEDEKKIATRNVEAAEKEVKENGEKSAGKADAEPDAAPVK